MTPRPQGRLYERLAAQLAGQIAAGRYAVGQRLPSERDLAQAYAVSRPTIREAIIALELDGLVEVRVGSGVYVTALTPSGGGASATDVGPFELLEARRAIEGEACALAAPRITDAALDELDRLVEAMARENNGDVAAAEQTDRRFHLLIADASENSAMAAAVEALWDARERSPQVRLMSRKAYAAGVSPGVEEHAAIVAALRTGAPAAARAAMRRHLTCVLDALLAATEVQQLEAAEAQRRKYATDA